MDVRVTIFMKLIGFSVLVCTLWKIFSLTAIGANLLFARWATKMCSAMLGTKVSHVRHRYCTTCADSLREVLINTPNGEAPPLVTGSFGSADFMHSVRRYLVVSINSRRI